MSKYLLVALLFAAAALAASAQTADSNPAHEPSVFLGNDRPKNKKDKTPTSRAVTGKVVDDSGKPLEGALVTLTDTEKNQKLSFFTKKDGRYGFDDLSFSVDYQLQARYKNLASETKRLSQYDHRPNMVRILEVTSNASANSSTEPKADANSEPKKDAAPKQ